VVEHFLGKEEVAGSIPFIGSKYKKEKSFLKRKALNKKTNFKISKKKKSWLRKNL
jgi:hypothetical protein